jgi:hypothetical protein
LSQTEAVKLGMELAGPSHPDSRLQTDQVGPSVAATDLDAYQRTRLVSLAHSDPPRGWTKWTLSRLAEELVTRGIVATISPEEVRRALLTDILRARIESKSCGRDQMLVLTRKTNEQIVVGDSIRITVLETRDSEVVLAIEAPAENMIQSAEKLPDRGSPKARS